MILQRIRPLLSWALGFLTLLLLLLNLPEQLHEVLRLWLLFVALTAFTLNFGILLAFGEISPAHLFGIMALLTLGTEEGTPQALWAVAVGALLGGLVQVALSGEWLPRRRLTVHSLGAAAETMAQHTLTLYGCGALYLALGGRLPLGRMEPPDVLPLGALLLSYALGHLFFFVLRVWLEGRSVREVVGTNRFTLAAVVLVPVPFGVLGAVVVSDLDNLSVLIMFAGLVLTVIGAHGLSRAQFHLRQQLEELSSLSVVSQVLRTSLELNTLLDTIYWQVRHLLNVDNFTVALLDPTSHELSFPLAFRQGQRVELPPRELGQTLIDHVIDNSVPLLIERNVTDYARRLGLEVPDAPVYSWLGVPLLAPDRTLGAMVIFSSDPERRLAAPDRRLLMNIAAQASVTIENAQLYGQARERALQLATLNNISALLTGTLSLERVVNLVTSSAVLVADCEAVAVYLYQDEVLALARNVGLSESFQDDPLDPLIVTEEHDPIDPNVPPVVVADARSDLRVDDSRRRRMDEEGKRAWVELMLMAGETPLGVIVAYYNRPHVFSEAEIELMRNFAAQAALAVNNARRYSTIDTALERRIGQMQALYDISQELTSILNLQKIFDLVLGRALEGTQGDAGVLVVGAEDGGGLQAVASRGYPPRTFEHAVNLGAGVTPSVYETGRAVLLPDVRLSGAYRALNPRTRSQLSVPIRREDETLGAITVESETLDAFGAEDVTFITQLAAHAAVAIDNARLFRRIAENRDRLQVILDGLTEGVLLLDRNGTISLVNPRIQTLLGLSPTLLEGRLVNDVLRDTGSAFVARLGFTSTEMRLLLADLRAGQWSAEGLDHFAYELHEPQHVHLHRRIAPVRDESGALIGLLLVFVDETEQQELTRAREDLSRMIVHDLRSPLTAITASIKMLKDIIPAGSEYAPLVERTTEASMRAVRKLLNLVDSLLDIAKMESGQISLDREPTSLKAIAGSAVLQVDSLARELDIALAVELPDDLPPVDIDDEKIERVLLNLIDNALKFTPAAGAVQVRAYPSGQAGAEAGFLRVEVRDSGPGIPDDYKERLFNRFMQVDGLHGRRRGTGLGLTFCRLAVEAHGGRIWIEDNPGGGAVFALTLPVASVPPQEENEPHSAEGPLL